MVRVAGITQQALARAAASCSTFLSDRELRRYRALGAAKQGDWLAGRLALKHAFAAHTSATSPRLSEIAIAYLPTGQPYIPGCETLRCSLAHSADWGLGAVSAEPVGVDIERIRPRRKELLAAIADEREIGAVQGESGDPSALVTAVWTVKESVMKASGEGLAVPPRALRIHQDADWPGAFVVEVLAGTHRDRLWHVFVSRVEDFSLAIALPYPRREEGDGTISIDWYSPPGVQAPGRARVPRGTRNRREDRLPGTRAQGLRV